eukprot:CAMPEP_0184871820 /NCGR_PEP_ID=MMETSP0580-20130426/40938_1 /TAXON_ID=1118495 /ORGANISM="Dactyliosolen fragilissimus" /LENGTH=120 /DNA_ID=CAMNT_0027374531 /DNA_START=71 /DNA_END=433 /DNA_ORIENTATION=-
MQKKWNKGGVVTKDLLKAIVPDLNKLPRKCKYRVCRYVLKKVDEMNPLPVTPPRQSGQFSVAASSFVLLPYDRPQRSRKKLANLFRNSPKRNDDGGYSGQVVDKLYDNQTSAPTRNVGIM